VFNFVLFCVVLCCAESRLALCKANSGKRLNGHTRLAVNVVFLVLASLVATIKLSLQAILKINFILLFLIYHDEMRRPFSAA
jgi:hypothetical protein